MRGEEETLTRQTLHMKPQTHKQRRAREEPKSTTLRQMQILGSLNLLRQDSKKDVRDAPRSVKQKFKRLPLETKNT